VLIIVYRVATFNNCDAAYRELVKVKIYFILKESLDYIILFYVYIGNWRS